MHRIFISYKRIDKDKVFQIKDLIESALGEKCWIDFDGIESNAIFETKIIGAINNCQIFLFMYSNIHTKIEDFENDWTIRELNFASAKKKNIVFINIDNAPLTDWFQFRFGMKQQIDALSVESISRLLNDIKNWLKLPEQEVKISNGDSHNKYSNTTNCRKKKPLLTAMTESVFSDRFHPIVNMCIACQLLGFGLIFLMVLWTFFTGCLSFYQHPQISHVMLLIALSASLICTLKVSTHKVYWLGSIIFLDFIEVFLISHLGEFLYFNWKHFSILSYPVSIRYQLLYFLGKDMQFHKVVGTHLYLLYIAIAHSVSICSLMFTKKNGISGWQLMN